MEFRLELTLTNILIAVNIFMYILSIVIWPFFDGSFTQTLYYLGANSYNAIIEGEIWRLVTSSFLHANPIHLFFNMYALYYLGHLVEQNFHEKNLLKLYVYAGIAGSIFSAISYYVSGVIGMQDTSLAQVSVGASGAIFGILGFLISKPSYVINKQPIYMILVINLFISLTFPNIDLMAHVGGLAGGIIVGLLDNQSAFKIDNKKEDVLYKLAIFIIGLSYAGLLVSKFV